MRKFETQISGVNGEWPTPPTKWSFSALKDVEACPRRWALSNATYRGIWEGRGYPRRPSLSTLTGHVIHRSAESILRSLSSAGCCGFEDPTSAVVLRDLGGISGVLDLQLEAELNELRLNPRATRMRDYLKRQLTEQVPSMRTAVQQLMRSVERISPRQQHPFPASRQPSRLRPGTYPEQVVEDDALRFMGVIDLLEVTEDGAEIVDFKTGSPDVAHEEQLRCYAALWKYDMVRNPEGRPATRLRVVYPSGSIDLALDGVDYDDSRDSLRTRTLLTGDALEKEPPKASPSPDTCQYCPVRHLCDEYWESGTNEARTSTIDVEMQVLELRTASSGTVRLPRTSSDAGIFGHIDGIVPGDRVRALELNRAADDETSEVQLRVSPQSELFVMRAE